MNAFEIKEAIISDNDKSPFEIIQSICTLTHSYSDNSPVIQDLLLHILDKRSRFKSCNDIINSLLRKYGLFPYLVQDDLSFSDAIAYELHKFNQHELKIVFHRQQFEVYSHISNGENIILSAPTSFGKSLIIEALVADNIYANIVIILPTIALIDEMRRALNKYSDNYKVITHNSQEKGNNNIFIFTQERFYENHNLPKIDFFVIDEFYKLNPAGGNEDNSRCYALNKTFYRLLKNTNRFYLLGPNIDNIDFKLPDNISHKFFKTDFRTVAANIIYFANKKGENKTDRLIRLCGLIKDSTLIYCYSPANASTVALALESNLETTLYTANSDFSDWLGINYHPEWVLVKSIKKGIALHHGKLPRAISQYCIKKFNSSDKEVDFLICTSTMIEGVNTKAKNIIIYDNTIGANKRFDYFTFNNICGRSGRMLKHFVGDIYLFHQPPQQELPIVNPPILSQGANAPASLLIELDNDDVSQTTRDKLQEYINNRYLPLYILKKNSKYDLEKQIALAHNITKDASAHHYYLSWTGAPTGLQFVRTCKLLFDYGFLEPRMSAGYSDADSLARMIWEYKSCISIGEFIRRRTRGLVESKEINRVIDTCFDFARNTMSYKLPNALNALDLIQTHVFTSILMDPGSYSFFSSLIENYFQDPIFSILDEYGLPVEIAMKISDVIIPYESVDHAITKIANYDARNSRLSKFEIKWLSEVQKEL